MARSRQKFEPEPKSFMDYVQHHERTWGTNNYTERPGLGDIMGSPVVAFWKHNDDDGLFRITLHDDLAEIEKYFLRMLFTSQSGAMDQKLSRVYKNQKRMAIKGVKIEFDETDE